KKTKESSDFYEKSTNEKKTTKDQYRNYIDKYVEHLESEIRQKNRQIDDLTIALKKEQSLNLNSQNILGNNEKLDTDNMNKKEDVFVSETHKENEQNQSFFQNYSGENNIMNLKNQNNYLNRQINMEVDIQLNHENFKHPFIYN